MADPSFEQLVKNFADRQQQEAAENAAKWEERKVWWIARVRQLFDEIDVWLKPLLDSRAVESVRAMMPANEETIGSYDIPWLELRVAGKKLTLLPKGTLVVGASGRIDANGPEGEVSLLLIDADASMPAAERRARASWFIRHPSKPLPRSRSDLRPLNEATFKELFADLFGILR